MKEERRKLYRPISQASTYVRFSSNEVAKSKQIKTSVRGIVIVIDFDVYGSVVGVELVVWKPERKKGVGK